MVKLKSHKIKHTTLCDLLSVFIEYRIPAFIKYRIFKSKHLPIAFYFKVEIVIQICFDCCMYFVQFLFALSQYHHVVHISEEIGRTDVPVRIARRIVQIQVIRTAVLAIVTVTADKGDRREQEHRPTPHPISLYSFF